MNDAKQLAGQLAALLSLRELEAERDKYKQALQNIAQGDTPWMTVEEKAKDAAEVFMRYAREVLKDEPIDCKNCGGKGVVYDDFVADVTPCPCCDNFGRR